MSTLVGDVEPRRSAIAVGGPRYDALIALLCAVFQGGAYLDLWAHVHQPELETFFTPWHAVLARDQLAFVPAALVAGALADVLVRGLRPSVRRPGALRTVAFAVPAVYFALFFGAVAVVRGVWWSVPLWSGAIVLAGATGWLLSWLVAPPAVPGEVAGDAPRKFYGAERHNA